MSKVLEKLIYKQVLPLLNHPYQSISLVSLLVAHVYSNYLLLSIIYDNSTSHLQLYIIFIDFMEAIENAPHDELLEYWNNMFVVVLVLLIIISTSSKCLNRGKILLFDLPFKKCLQKNFLGPYHIYE